MLNATTPIHIAIIGAGIAGLSCATAIRQASVIVSSAPDTNPNITVSVFEKSRGVAGRMSTRRGDGWQCDHGAQYFTAHSAEFRAEVARWEAAGVAGIWKPIVKSLPGGSLPLPNDEFSPAWFVGIPRMTSPAQWLATAQTIHTATTIQELQPENVGDAGKFPTRRWLLKSAESGLFEQQFDAVVLAIPAPQALPLLGEFALGLTQIARQAKIRRCWTLMMQVSENVSNPFDFDAAFVNRGPLGWIARDGSKLGREQSVAGQQTWLLHATPEWSDANLEQNADHVAATLINAYVELGGAPPQSWTAHRWRYSTIKPDEKPNMTSNFAWDDDVQIGLCGDWLAGGNVEAAWLSGQRLATRILSARQLA